MFERYTDKARRIIFFARYEASSFGAKSIESEHLLLGLAREDPALLSQFGINAERVDHIRKWIELKTPQGPKTSTSLDLPLSHASKRVLAYAAEESERMGVRIIAPAHLLMGLLRETGSLAHEVLQQHGVELPRLRETVASNPAAPSPEAGMLKLIANLWASHALYAAVQLGLPDLLNDGPKSVDALAAATNTQPHLLYRVLRALAGSGVFHELEPRHFATTPLAQTLVSDRPGTLRHFVLNDHAPDQRDAWDEFPLSLRTGRSAFEEKFGEPIYTYFQAHPEAGQRFWGFLNGVGEWVTYGILNGYDFSAFRRIVDVGGGQGHLLATVLARVPEATGVLFDTPQVIGNASTLETLGLSERVEHVGGDFFVAVPEGGDLYVLKWVMQDWGDEQCVVILRNVRKAMAPGGRVLIAGGLVGGAENMFTNFFDVNLMAKTGGQERSEAEYQMLLEKSGFAVVRVIRTDSATGLIEAVAA